MLDRPVRLSVHVLCIEHDDHVTIQHAVRGWQERLSRAEWTELLRFRAFREAPDEHAHWVDVGALVQPFQDSIAHHGGAVEGTDAHLAAAYHRWYWQTEADAERSYRWLGQPIVKMPTDLFFYQELMTACGVRSVLEIGSGHGGGIWFFASTLGLLGGGTVIGVDIDPGSAFDGLPGVSGVRTSVVRGDARDASTVERVQCSHPGDFDLIVFDAPPHPAEKIDAIANWARLLRPGGIVVLEDVSSLENGDTASSWHALDRFLLEQRHFGVIPHAGRHPFLKSWGATVQRLF